MSVCASHAAVYNQAPWHPVLSVLSSSRDFEHMPLSLYQPKQMVNFIVVSSKLEESWKTKTLCLRLLLSDGCQCEMQCVNDAIVQMRELAKLVAFSAEISRAMIKLYSGASKTGILSKTFIRCQYKTPSLKRAEAGFAADIIQDRLMISPGDIEQLADGSMCNVAGVVHELGTVPGTNSASPSHPSRLPANAACRRPRRVAA